MILVAWTDGTWQEVGRYEYKLNLRNLPLVQQQYAQRSAPVKIIVVSDVWFELAWITEDEQDFLVLLQEPPPPLTVKAMEPYPAAALLMELANALASP